MRTYHQDFARYKRLYPTLSDAEIRRLIGRDFDDEMRRRRNMTEWLTGEPQSLFGQSCDDYHADIGDR